MEKSVKTITMDYSSAKTQAKKLDEIAGNLRKLANGQLSTTLGNVSNAWTGDVAKKYISKGNQLKKEILDQAAKLEKMAASIRKVAKNTYDADLAAAQLAQKKS